MREGPQGSFKLAASAASTCARTSTGEAERKAPERFPPSARRLTWITALKPHHTENKQQDDCRGLVALYPGTSDSEKISFNQINKSTGHRVKYLKVDADTGLVAIVLRHREKQQ